MPTLYSVKAQQDKEHPVLVEQHTIIKQSKDAIFIEGQATGIPTAALYTLSGQLFGGRMFGADRQALIHAWDAEMQRRADLAAANYRPFFLEPTITPFINNNVSSTNNNLEVSIPHAMEGEGTCLPCRVMDWDTLERLLPAWVAARFPGCSGIWARTSRDPYLVGEDGWGILLEQPQAVNRAAFSKVLADYIPDKITAARLLMAFDRAIGTEFVVSMSLSNAIADRELLPIAGAALPNGILMAFPASDSIAFVGNPVGVQTPTNLA